MARYAIIDGGVVVNMAAADAPLEDNWVASDVAQIGWLYADGEFSPPPEPPVPVPAAVSMRQARLALLAAGLLDQVETAMAGASAADQIEWEYATEVRRDSPLVASMTAALGWTAGQVDDLFVAAASL